jgi:hypothetical protein
VSVITESPPRSSALVAARGRPCRAEWCSAQPGTPCTGKAEPDGDHFIRYVDAASAGDIRLGAMLELIAIVEHIQSQPVIPAELAEEISL